MKAGLGWGLTLLNIGVAMISVLCLGYFWGYEHGQQSVRHHEGVAGYSNAVAPNTTVGAGQHPTFDCRTMKSEVQVGSSELSVDKVAGSRKDLSGSSIRVKGQVVSAFKNIMGLNWLHLCSRPNGPVLVAASTQWIDQGEEVVVEGILSLERNIGGAYVFPLFVENATLIGEGVSGVNSNGTVTL